MLKKRILLLSAALLTVINIVLLVIDTDDEVARISYIKDWSQIFPHDLYETTIAAGVVAPVEHTPVYFDAEQGQFSQFLVQKGDQVKQGDSLYEFHVRDYQRTEKQLQQDGDKLAAEISAIQRSITEISAYQVSEASVLPPVLENDDQPEAEPPSYEEIEYLKEQYITEKELELASKQAELDSIEAQQAELASGGDLITVESPVAGTVTDVKETLKNPVISIASEEFRIEGELTESQRKVVESGMEVNISLQDPAIQTEGTVEAIEDIPEQIDTEKTSKYGLHVQLEETEDPLLAGYHANMEIITDQALKTPTVFTRQLDREGLSPSLWIMNQDGTLELRPIELGLSMDIYQEIESGAESGEWIADHQDVKLYHGTKFITPIKENLVPWRKILHQEKGSFKKAAFLTGIASR
ncbi:efflux RND transporter periplasmic adaptor subunit [Sediminibacillus albus]|uniref:HlyD family secretion protein n=1 Tax=Sediminibacillus albus TaxID=407036 RepID=A0A1G9AVE6_9BACI|nr:efflux RND transporter periplasmic adaptor subunit [Sediminibacillus albus]SDK30650.1 HlyD family secretion protein [Sediminibacillus albus]